MALINCPECGKEISDQAISCPNCGYRVAENIVQSKPFSAEEAKKKKKKIIYIVGAVVAFLVVIVAMNVHTNTSNPFEKLDKGMSQSKVCELLGEPSYIREDQEFSILIDRYNNKSLFGVNGTFEVWYKYNSREVDYAIWTKEIPEGKDFDDYNSQILEIKKGIAKICGNEDNYMETEWEDVVGNRYRLKLYSDSDELLPDSIQVWFDPK